MKPRLSVTLICLLLFDTITVLESILHVLLLILDQEARSSDSPLTVESSSQCVPPELGTSRNGDSKATMNTPARRQEVVRSNCLPTSAKSQWAGHSNFLLTNPGADLWQTPIAETHSTFLFLGLVSANSFPHHSVWTFMLLLCWTWRSLPKSALHLRWQWLQTQGSVSLSSLST